MRFVALLILATCLSGCGGADIVRGYEMNTMAMPFMDQRDTWRIWDLPAEGKLMIQPSAGREVQIGVANGLSFSDAGDLPKPEYQDAVEGWLARGMRSCHVTDGYKIRSVIWEFKYQC